MSDGMFRPVLRASNCSWIRPLGRAGSHRAGRVAGPPRRWPIAILVALACILAAPAGAQDPEPRQGAERFEDVLDQIASLAKSGERDRAAEAAQAASGDAEKELGPDSVAAARRLHRIGNTLRWEGLVTAAEPHLIKALAVFEREAAGKPTRDLAATLNELGWVTVNTLRIEEARSYFTRALEMKEKLLEPDHIEIAYLNDGLATMSVYASELEAGVRFAERALQIKLVHRAADDNEVIYSRALLATALFKQGQLARAGQLLEENLAAEQGKPAPDELRLGDMLGVLAIVAEDRGERAKAERLALQSKEILERRGATQRSSYFSLHLLLAKLYASTERFSEAEAAAGRVIRAGGAMVTPRQVMDAHNTLSVVYMGQMRYVEAEQATKRALSIAEERFGENSLDTATMLENLAYIYATVGRSAEALDLFARILRIRMAVLPADHALIGSIYANRAIVLNALRRHEEAESDAREAVRIMQAVYGPSYRMVQTARDQLGTALKGLRRLDEAVQVYRELLRLLVEAGETADRIAVYDHNLALVLEDAGRYAEAEAALLKSMVVNVPGTVSEAQSLKVLASIHLKMGRRAEARQNYRRATALFAEAFKKGATGLREYEGAVWLRSTASEYLATLLDSDDLGSAEQTAAGAEAFGIAQWMLRTTASASLAQMGARLAASNGQLAGSVRARQDAIQRWQSLNTALDRLISTPIAERNQLQAGTVRGELAKVEAELATLDGALAEQFPDFVELSSPSPLSAEEVRKLLKPGEALVQFMQLDKRTVIWVVTETGVVWRQLAVPAEHLAQRISELRCGLDYDGAWALPGSRCAELLGVTYTAEDREAGKPLPFDLARAHDLYAALLGPVAQLIRGKHLLVVPSGALAQLPLQVMVQSLPAGVAAGEQPREVALLGAELRDLSEEERRQTRIEGKDGVLIVKPVAGGAAERAGLIVGDVLLAVNGTAVTATAQAVQTVRSQMPRSRVSVAIWRQGKRQEIDVELGVTTIKEWRPLFLEPSAMRDVAWLGRTHAITVLPAVSSLKALRKHAKPSQAARPYLGVGNPLLDGPDQSYRGLSAAARERELCGRRTPVLMASAQGRGVRAPFARRGSIADVADLRRAAPLPETADELCDVAQVLGAGEDEVLLGVKASEPEIMRLSEAGRLRDYRILHFATHGALAGEVSGTAEPGLLLTPPEKGSESDDGYLSASEISSLKLDADWVILSACNTAAGQAADTEALSGLARAFFYAGARALLVSHWYVDSSATVALVKGAFAQLKADPALGRAEAVRRAMLGLIESGDGAQAHPSAWAPFVVVGEGSAAN